MSVNWQIANITDIKNQQIIFHCLKLSVNTASEVSITFDSLTFLVGVKEINQQQKR